MKYSAKFATIWGGMKLTWLETWQFTFKAWLREETCSQRLWLKLKFQLGWVASKTNCVKSKLKFIVNYWFVFFYEAEFEFQVESICRHIAAINLEYLGSLRIGFQSALIVIKPSYCDGFFFHRVIYCLLAASLEMIYSWVFVSVRCEPFFWTAFYIFGVLLFICT